MLLGIWSSEILVVLEKLDYFWKRLSIRFQKMHQKINTKNTQKTKDNNRNAKEKDCFWWISTFANTGLQLEWERKSWQVNSNQEMQHKLSLTAKILNGKQDKSLRQLVQRFQHHSRTQYKNRNMGWQVSWWKKTFGIHF